MPPKEQQDDPYIIRGGTPGRSRLEILHQALAPGTQAFFSRCGLAPGHQGLDLGCGGGAVTLDLARIVGPQGSVTGIDKDADNISFAQRKAAALGLSQVSYQQADVREWERKPDQYDFAYARFLLTHLSDPAALIQRIQRTLKPGGRILLEDIDFTGHFCYPACKAFRLDETIIHKFETIVRFSKAQTRQLCSRK